MKTPIYIITVVLLVCITVLTFTACNKEICKKYNVDYCGAKDCYSNAKDSYKAGTKVTLYYDLIATDTDYSFTLDGEPVKWSYDVKKGIVIEFTMPEHDVKLECHSHNSMLPYYE